MTKSNRVLLCVAILCQACAKTQGAEYYPQASEGTETRYAVQTRTLFAGIQNSEILHRMKSDTTIDGKSYSRRAAIVTGMPGVPSGVEHIRVDRHGVYTRLEQGGEYLMVPFPLTSGKTWTVNVTGLPGDTLHYAVAGFESLETVARRYDRCMKVTMRGRDIESSEWLAPGIGLVKSVVTMNGVVTEFVLKEK